MSTVNVEALKACELEMLKIFISVCEKLGLRYYLVEGTLLGAVRHQGFIPWDDDIDVGMPREDYEIFLKEGQALLPEGFFLQSYKSEPGYRTPFAKIRNSNTTYIETTARYLPINHGVYIDVFPIDYYKESRKDAFLRRVYKARLSCSFYTGKKSLKRRARQLLYRLACPSVARAMKRLDRLCANVPEGELVTLHGSAWGAREIVPASWYGDGVKLSFEGVEVTAPAEYDKLLTQIYGDYMTPPPPEKRVGHHYADVIDTETSYVYYTKKNKG